MRRCLRRSGKQDKPDEQVFEDAPLTRQIVTSPSSSASSHSGRPSALALPCSVFCPALPRRSGMAWDMPARRA